MIGSAARRSVPIPRALIDLAAGRLPAADTVLDEALVEAATEHRMAGLLWSWSQGRDGSDDLRVSLTLSDLWWRGHLERVETVLTRLAGRLGEAGIVVAALKGVAAESRWYERHGERPCVDVDLLLGPDHADQVAKAIHLIDPDHPWLPTIDDLVASGGLQSVTLRADGVEVDLHLDPLKLGIETRHADRFWSRVTVTELPHGGVVRAPDATAQLVMFLVHLNKDRFQRLLGFADVARLLRSGEVDWAGFDVLVRGEGLEVPVLRSLEVVLETLELPWPGELVRPTGPRAWLWDRIWPPRVRLRGPEGRLRFRKRQNWIGMLARGRTVEGARWWMLEALPPRAAVRTHYAHVRGPYVWKLAIGRLEARRAHRRRLSELRQPRTGSE